MVILFLLFFFFNDTATTEIYTLSLHDALPISTKQIRKIIENVDSSTRILLDECFIELADDPDGNTIDRKSTRLNSSHANISYAVFCLKKKKRKYTDRTASKQVTYKHRKLVSSR